MNYNNNYYNPNGYGYNSYMSQQNYGYQQNNLSKTIFSFVNGIDEARAFIVSPMQTAYLMDNNSSHLFIKKADNMGKYIMEDYIVTKAEQETNNYVSKTDFANLQNQISQLTQVVNTLVQPQNTTPKE